MGHLILVPRVGRNGFSVAVLLTAWEARKWLERTLDARGSTGQAVGGAPPSMASERSSTKTTELLAVSSKRSSQQKRQRAGGNDWLDAPFSELADLYLADTKARKKPATFVSRRYGLLRLSA